MADAPRLIPMSSWSRKWADDDGRLICNHGDSTACTLTGHTTIILYAKAEDLENPVLHRPLRFSATMPLKEALREALP